MPGMNLLLVAAAQTDEKEFDFMIKGIHKFYLFGQELWITTTHLAMWVISAFIIIMALVMRHKIMHPKEVPSGLQNVAEIIVEMLDNMVKGAMGKHGYKFANYIAAIFIFILISNISGLFGLRPPTADFGVTLPLGLMTFCIIQYNNIKYNKAGAFTGLFKPLPLLFPINLIGEIATPFSLALRLFGNILSGTVIMTLIYGLVPFLVKLGIPAFLHAYMDLFAGAIQTYVFCMLTMVYTQDKIGDA